MPNKLASANNSGKVTFLALAMAFFYLGYDAFAASGWQLNEAFYVGIVFVVIGAGMLIAREYWKAKYGQDLTIDMAEVQAARDAFMNEAREFRDLLKAHTTEQIAAADAMIAIAALSGMDDDKIADMNEARNRWQELLDAI